jgi:3'-phosphoadenosine 5'-phosphosulfate sulfotransferase (PAPS reductase)/FAD synthetase
MSNLDKKVERAIRLLQAIPSDDIELAFSGGKDSSVILKLAQMAGIKFTPIYKNTTIDPSGNIQFCKSMGCTITPPHKTFFELVQERGFPTRRARFCCEVLKEYKIKDYVIIGVRKAESTARSKRYNEPEICRVYGNKGKKKADGSNYCKQYLPIVNWTDEDVREFIRFSGEKYYVNLKEVNALALRRAGVKHIEISEDCTMCRPDRYWSHRITGNIRGSQGAIIVCKEETK